MRVGKKANESGTVRLIGNMCRMGSRKQARLHRTLEEEVRSFALTYFVSVQFTRTATNVKLCHNNEGLRRTFRGYLVHSPPSW
jgi:hypothetical protein